MMDDKLEEVKKYLNVLSNEIVEKEINELRLSNSYDNVDAKFLADSILKKYGVNSDVVLKKEVFFKRKFNDLGKAFNHIVDRMGKNDFKANLKIILDIIVLLLFISLCKIPFIVVRNLGEGLLGVINFSFAYDIWAFFIELVYIVIAVMIFINVFPKWFKNLKPSNNKVKEEKKVLNDVVNEPQKMGNDLESVVINDDKNNE